MKDYSVDIDFKTAATEMYRETAFAAKERGEYSHVATEDDYSMIERFFIGAMPALRGAFGRHLKGSGENIVYSMPENWAVDEDSIKRCCFEFLINTALARWFALSGTGEMYAGVANGALETISFLLNKRIKPIR